MKTRMGSGAWASLLVIVLLGWGVGQLHAAALIIDHNDTDIASIPLSAINNAKSKLHIAYGHTSHGSQLTTGMTGLVGFADGGGKGMTHPTDTFVWSEGGTGGALDLDDYFVEGDLGSPDRTTWATRTRAYLNDSANSDVNVVIWSWCGQADTTEANINTYLSLMNGLETDYSDVYFVYMTGHLVGTGLTGDLHLRNEQIRDYCAANNKILYDFADIETWDPDGTYWGGKLPDDCCDYDADGALPRTATGNWAVEWQNSHTQGVDWYTCTAAHTQPLNANLKAYAAWALWTEVAAIPEPSTVCLVGLGLGGLALLRRRRKK